MPVFGAKRGAEALLGALLAGAVDRADLAPGVLPSGVDDGFQLEGFGLFA
jgi:hypothetical protein